MSIKLIAVFEILTSVRWLSLVRLYANPIFHRPLNSDILAMVVLP